MRYGSILADEQGQAARKEDVLNVLSQLASKLRSRLGESLATVEKHDTPLEDATTSSLEALKTYSTARKVKFLPAGYASAVPLLKHAIEIDPYLRNGLRVPGAHLRRCWRRVCSLRLKTPVRPTNCGTTLVSAKGSSSRCDLPSASHGKPGEGAPDAGVMGGDLSSR